MNGSGTEQQKGTAAPLPHEFATYYEWLSAVRTHKKLRLKDVSEASAHPDWPKAFAKMSALSRMEAGDTKNPTFRQIVRYARGYGVSMDDLASFFYSDYSRAPSKKSPPSVD